MEHLSHELSVLSRAVAHKNLSGASAHVGLSQPQLSRIVKRAEEELGVVLLDRSSKRGATWTPTAYQVAEFYSKRQRMFERELEALVQATQVKRMEIGTLEGLSGIALPFVHHLMEKQGIRLVEIDIYDLDGLEARFLRGQLDLIFTFREPGRRKLSYVQNLGFQSLDEVSSNPDFHLVSTFQYGAQREKLKKAKRVLISNSLSIRREWLQRFGGTGNLPSVPKRQRTSRADTEPVLMVGAETLSPQIWKTLKEVSF